MMPATSAAVEPALRAKVRRAAGQPAFLFDGVATTWQDIADLADRLDATVGTLTIGHDALIGVLTRNRPEQLATILALIHLGRPITPINAVAGVNGVRGDLDALQLGAVVGAASDWQRPGMFDACRGNGAAGIAVTAGLDVSTERVGSRGPEVSHGDVMLLMPTSGTTGPPKRIPLPAATIDGALASTRVVERHRAALRDRADAPALLHSPLMHIGGLWRMFEAIVTDSVMILAERFTVDEWRQAVSAYRPVASTVSPAGMRMVLDAGVPAAELASLNVIYSGSAPVMADLVEEWEAAYDHQVLTVYGATEFAGGIASWTIADKERYWPAKRGSVGRLNPGIEARTLVEAAGSHEQDTGALELRAEHVQGGRWITTTDLARIDADGFLFLQGRTDDVIIRGEIGRAHV